MIFCFHILQRRCRLMLVKEHKAHDRGLAWSEKKNKEAPDYVYEIIKIMSSIMYTLFTYLYTRTLLKRTNTHTQASRLHFRHGRVLFCWFVYII